VFVGEPTLMQVADAHKSVAGYSTIVHGHAAHSSKPSLGASAIEAACDLVTGLYRFAEELAARGDPPERFDPPASTIHVGKIMAEPREISWLSFAHSSGSFARPRSCAKSGAQHLEDYAGRVVTPSHALRQGRVLSKP
jgi:acetylornithine deacetylase